MNKFYQFQLGPHWVLGCPQAAVANQLHRPRDLQRGGIPAKNSLENASL
jgi:hypothetical protein